MPFPQPATLWDMLNRWKLERPERVALIDPAGETSYERLFQEATSLACQWLDRGLSPGDVVGVALSRRSALATTFLGVTGAGLSFMPLHPHRSPRELNRLCNAFSVRGLVLEKTTWKTLQFCRKGRVTVALDGTEGDVSWEEATSLDSPSLPAYPRLHDSAYLNLTSGSTGAPKAAETTHEGLYWNTRGTIEALNFTEDEPFLCLFSSHAHPHEHFCRPLFVGGTSVLEPSNNPKRVLNRLQEHSIRCVMAVPSLYRILCRSMPPGQTQEGLRLLESGGAPSDRSLLDEVKARFGVHLCPVWGSTETVGVALASALNTPPRPGYVGQPVPYYDVSLEKTDLGEELLVDGLGLYSAYRMPNGERVPRKGVHRTGDLFEKDDRGQFRFLGRTTSVLKVAGEKVHPEKVEEVLREHPLVRECLVLGIRHTSKGQVPVAFLVGKAAQRPQAKDLRAFCLQRLTSQETPKRFEWVDTLPRLPGGKLDRNLSAKELQERRKE